MRNTTCHRKNLIACLSHASLALCMLLPSTCSTVPSRRYAAIMNIRNGKTKSVYGCRILKRGV